MNRRHSFSMSNRYQRGAHVAAFLMTVLSLFFAAGLGVDAGRMFVVKSELQHAADACALSASSELTGAATANLTRSENFGITAGAANKVDFQKKSLTLSSNSTVTFSNTLNGTYVTKGSISPANAKYVRCTVDSPSVAYFLFPVLNALAAGTVTPQSLRATAIATLDPAIAACVMPLGVCSKGPTAAPWGYSVGEWACGRKTPSGTSPTCNAQHADDLNNEWSGSFRWLKLPGYESVPEIRALLQGAGQCSTPENLTEVDAKTGNINGLKNAWNSRFGVHDGANYSGVPDYAGAAYTDADTSGGTENWGVGVPQTAGDGIAPGSSAFAEFALARTNNQNWSGVWESPDASLNTVSNTYLGANGSDRRVVAFPIIGCPGSGNGNNRDYDLHGYACMLMLHPIKNPNDGMKLEYLGDANDTSSANPCAGQGLPGGGAGPKVPGLVY